MSLLSRLYFLIPSVAFVLLYWQSIFFGAAFPDDPLVIAPIAQDFKLMLKTFYDNSKMPGVHFTPVSTLQCFLINKVFGENAYPFGFHLYQFIAQTLVCLLATILFYKLTRSRLISVLIVSLWTVHPINLQQITRLLCGSGIAGFAFFLIFLLCFLQVKETHRPSLRLILVLLGSLFFLLAILTVETFFFLPLVLYLIYFYLEGVKIFKSREYLYLFVPLAIYPIYFLWRYFACGGSLSETSDELIRWTEIGSVKDILFRAFWLCPQLLVHYFKLFLFSNSPIDTKAEWYMLGETVWSPYSFFCQLLIFSVITAAIFLFKKIPLFSIGILWFFLSIFLMIQIIPLFSIVAVRYFYVSSLGLFLSVFSVVLYYKKYLSPKILVIIVLPIFLMFSYKTLYYLPSSKDKLTQSIWMAKEAPPFIKVLYMNLVVDEARESNRIGEIPDWISPDSIGEKFEEWVKSYLNMKPNLSNKFGPIQMCYNYNLYKLLMKHLYVSNRFNEMNVLMNQAVEVKNDSYGWIQLASFLKDIGQWGLAWNALRKTIELNPKHRFLYGEVFLVIAKNVNKFEEAEHLAKNYVLLNPRIAYPDLFLGTLYAEFNKENEALQSFKEGIKGDKIPSTSNKKLYLAVSDIFKYYKMFNEAKEALKIVISFDPFDLTVKQKLKELEHQI